MPQHPGRDGKDANIIPKILTTQWFFQLLVLNEVCMCVRRERGEIKRGICFDEAQFGKDTDLSDGFWGELKNKFTEVGSENRGLMNSFAWLVCGSLKRCRTLE